MIFGNLLENFELKEGKVENSLIRHVVDSIEFSYLEFLFLKSLLYLTSEIGFDR